METVTTKELEDIVKTQISAVAGDPSLAAALPPIMVWGAPGLGKSSVLRGIAEELGIGFIDVRLAQREPVDSRGLPVPGEDGVRWLVSSEWPRDPSSRGIILFDEITAADRSLQVAAYEFILDRRLGTLYSVPDGWFICAAGNRTEDRAVATGMSSALSNRFLHVELTGDVESWTVWARRHNVAPQVIGFLRYRPELLFHQEGENLERGWPSPRAWERVSHILRLFRDADPSILRKAVYGLVGDRAGVEFMAFLELGVDSNGVLEMMYDPKETPDIPTTADRRYALCSAMTYELWRGRTPEDAAQRMDGFFRISLALPSDFASMAMIDAMSGADKDEEAAHAAALFRHPMYKAWAERHGAALRQGA